MHTLVYVYIMVSYYFLLFFRIQGIGTQQNTMSHYIAFQGIHNRIQCHIILHNRIQFNVALFSVLGMHYAVCTLYNVQMSLGMQFGVVLYTYLGMQQRHTVWYKQIVCVPSQKSPTPHFHMQTCRHVYNACRLIKLLQDMCLWWAPFSQAEWRRADMQICGHAGW